MEFDRTAPAESAAFKTFLISLERLAKHLARRLLGCADDKKLRLLSAVETLQTDSFASGPESHPDTASDGFWGEGEDHFA